MGTGGNQVNAVVQESPEVDTFAMQGFGDYIKSDVVSSCRARDYKDATDLVCAVDCRNGTENPDINGTLQAKDNGGTSLNLNNVVRQRYVVRRLTPLECARLQGYPDKWLDIGDWIDDNGKKHKESDSVKYRALGNSIAIPPWLFVLGRLNEFCDDKGMASLFDGISGFPLIWSFLNGKENCVWSSEVDSFCRAVARIRFPDTSDDAKTRSKN
jgi:DNA (cytosine-5)-methyltransferase 1